MNTSFDQKDSDTRPIYYNNLFGMLDGMENPDDKDTSHVAYKKTNMRNSCLQNDIIKVLGFGFASIFLFVFLKFFLFVIDKFKNIND